MKIQCKPKDQSFARKCKRGLSGKDGRTHVVKVQVKRKVK